MSILYVVEQEDSDKLVSPYDIKCVLAASYAEVEIQTKPIEVGDGKYNKSEEYSKKSPTKSVPCLELKEGFIWESNAIMRYFASVGKNKNLLGTGFYAASVNQIIDFVESSWHEVNPLITSIYTGKKPNKAEVKVAETALTKIIGVLGNILEDNTFLVGERVSLADIHVFSNFKLLFEKHYEAEDRVKMRSFTRWFTTMANQKNSYRTSWRSYIKSKKKRKKLNLPLVWKNGNVLI